jgi:hypothetical protein
LNVGIVLKVIIKKEPELLFYIWPVFWIGVFCIVGVLEDPGD